MYTVYYPGTILYVQCIYDPSVWIQDGCRECPSCDHDCLINEIGTS